MRLFRTDEGVNLGPRGGGCASYSERFHAALAPRTRCDPIGSFGRTIPSAHSTEGVGVHSTTKPTNENISASARVNDGGGVRVSHRSDNAPRVPRMVRRDPGQIDGHASI
eukprot:1177225-Prorocentrum_minimum.AAC.1